MRAAGAVGRKDAGGRSSSTASIDGAGSAGAATRAGKDVMKPEWIAKAGLAAIGFLAWTAIALATATAASGELSGYHDAWDSRTYFWIAAPLAVAAIGFAGWRLPDGAWRWPLFLALGQGLAMFLFAAQGIYFGGLPIAFMSSFVACAPLFAIVYAGVGLRRLQDRRVAA